MSKQVIRVPPTSGFDVVLVDGPFDAGLAGLAEENVSLWGAEELAELRVQLGAAHSVSANGSWVSQNFNYMTDSDADVLVVSGMYSPLLKDPQAATRAHRDGKEVYLAREVVLDLRERAQTDPDRARSTGVFRLPRGKVRAEIPVTALDEDELARFLFGDQVKPYANLLQTAKVKAVPVYTADKGYAQKQAQPFARALWVSYLYGRSDLDGNDVGLHDDGGRVGGVRPYAREAGAPRLPVETGVAPVSDLEQRLRALQPGETLEHEGAIYARLAKR